MINNYSSAESRGVFNDAGAVSFGNMDMVGYGDMLMPLSGVMHDIGFADMGSCGFTGDIPIGS